MFLIARATHELHAPTEVEWKGQTRPAVGQARLRLPPRALGLFARSLCSTSFSRSIPSSRAIGMPQDIRAMIAAVLIAVAVMSATSRPVARFIAAYPTTKTLARAFLMRVGVALVADGFDVPIPRGYVYFAMAFAAAIESFNIWAARRPRDGT
jgi:hypothetical protein